MMTVLLSKSVLLALGTAIGLVVGYVVGLDSRKRW
jgi:hypothetical protein